MSFRKGIGITLSTWEAVALTTGLIPPLTAILRRHPLLGITATVWVAHHLLHDVPWRWPMDINTLLHRLRCVEDNIDHALTSRNRHRFHQLCEIRRQLKTQLNREMEVKATEDAGLTEDQC